MQLFKSQFSLDRLYLSFVQRDFSSLFNLINLYCDFFYLVHFCECLFYGLSMTDTFLNDFGPLRNKILYRYAYLLYQRGFWELATHYNVHCYPAQRVKILVCLDKFCTSDTQILKILDLLAHLDLKDDGTISDNLIHFYINNGNLADALLWSLKFKNTFLVCNIVNSFFDEYLRSNVPPARDIALPLSQLSVDHSNLKLYTNLCAFYESLELKSTEVCQKLADLLDSNLSSSLCLQLISNSVFSLLDQNLIDRECTFKLLESLNRLELLPKVDPSESYNHLIFVLREALVKNLVTYSNGVAN